MSISKEKAGMPSGVRRLLEASIKLECKIEITTRALILYHNFMRCIDGVEYDTSMVAAAALLHSSRINEDGLDIDTVILLFFCMVNNTNYVLAKDDKTFVTLKESLICVFYLMQRILEFNLNHRVAHQYLPPFLSVIFDRSPSVSRLHQAFGVTCLKILNDFYTDPKCLDFLPEHIATACIDVALLLHGFSDDLVMKNPWYEGFCNDLTLEKLEEIKNCFLDLYMVDDLIEIADSPPP